MAFLLSLIFHSFLSWSVILPIHSGDRKWPGSVKVAQHDRPPAAPPPWCRTDYGPLINNLVPVSLMSLHHRAANNPTNNDLMTHDVTSVCVCRSVSYSNVANTIIKDESFCPSEEAMFSLSYLVTPVWVFVCNGWTVILFHTEWPN